MVEYIYFVRFDDQEEAFNFFDEARAFALSQLNKKPCITQTEVIHNDFGECTDSSDLGTIWSWEELMSDIPEETVFSKADTLDCIDCDSEADLEFDNLDNSLDFVSDNFRKPIPDGMTIKDLVEEMEENEDEVECTWCNDLFYKDQCRYEINLGWLCSRCQAAIMSRGETLTFRENSYWDYLDEEAELEEAAANQKDEVIQDSEDTVECQLCHKQYPKSECHNEVERGYLCPLCIMDLDSQGIDLEFVRPLSEDLNETVDLEYKDLTIELTGPQRDVDDWDSVEYTNDYTYKVDKEEVITFLYEGPITEEDIVDVPGGFETLENDQTAWNKYFEEHFDDLFKKYYKQILDFFEENAIEDFMSHYTWTDYEEEQRSWYDENLTKCSNKTKSMLEELEDADSYRSRLTMCPECGELTYDPEAQSCINCGLFL